MYNIHMLDKP